VWLPSGPTMISQMPAPCTLASGFMGDGSVPVRVLAPSGPVLVQYQWTGLGWPSGSTPKRSSFIRVTYTDGMSMSVCSPVAT
jgi:hypothetical protein